MGRSDRVPITVCLIILVSFGLLVGNAGSVLSYERATHGEITATSVDRSILDAILKAHYGIDQGTELEIDGRSVRAWIALGAIQEDDPSFRSLNHFHNPLRPWAQAGGVLGQSSIYWQQNQEQGTGDTWSWNTARDQLFVFLTAEGPDARRNALARTSRALGQLMHMVQDAASPPHTRDDPHLIHDGYEARIEEMRTSGDPEVRARFELLLNEHAPLPPVSIFTPTGDPQAPVPVARLIDTDTYRGTPQSYSTGAQTGLAEYTNGGFVSDDTIFLDFSLPRRESLGPGFFDPPAGAPGARQYFPKISDGDAIPHFAAEGTLLERLRFRGQEFGGFILEDRVYEDYAARLLPRAVSYSAGLLNYFFRANFEFAVDPNRSDPTKRDLTIQIPPLLSAETMDGTFTLYAEDRDGIRRAVDGASTTLALGRGGFTRIVFTPPSGVRAYVLAFRGTLGDEPDAVAGRVKPLGPVVFAIQETAEFTDEEQLTSTVDTDFDIGAVSGFVATSTRTKDERKQRAKGRFFSPTTLDPGKHLRRVSLEFDSRVFGTMPVRILLDDVDVGMEWNRAPSSTENPRRWEIRFDLPAFGNFFQPGSIFVPNVPRFVVIETRAGVKMRIPLVWWRDLNAVAQFGAKHDFDSACPLELRCYETVSNGTSVRGLVFFGDGSDDGRDLTPTGGRHLLTAAHTSVGFIPTGDVAGHAVGTEDVKPSPSCFLPCIPAESCSSHGIRIFATSTPQGPVWAKDELHISFSDFSGVRKPVNTCVRPGATTPTAPDLPRARFRRDYLPADQSLFQELDVSPPDYEITLK